MAICTRTDYSQRSSLSAPSLSTASTPFHKGIKTSAKMPYEKRLVNYMLMLFAETVQAIKDIAEWARSDCSKFNFLCFVWSGNGKCEYAHKFTFASDGAPVHFTPRGILLPLYERRVCPASSASLSSSAVRPHRRDRFLTSQLELLYLNGEKSESRSSSDVKHEKHCQVLSGCFGQRCRCRRDT
jgi:hypothetical protein